MTPADAGRLLTICASFDNRKPDADQAMAWSLALAGLSFEACRDAIVSHYQESRAWIMPADVRGRVRRARAAAITHDEALELPPHDPDDTAAHIAALTWSRDQAAAGTPYKPEGLVRGNLRALGGPVRRVNEVDDEERATFADRAREAHKVALAELTATPELEPVPAPLFQCEQVVDDELCGRPAPHLSADRRRPLCDEHRPPEIQEDVA